MTRRLSVAAGLCALVVGACGEAVDQEAVADEPAPAAAETGGPRPHERFQIANDELMRLLSEAARTGADISEYQARLGPIVFTGTTDMAQAADDVETLLAEARAALTP